MNRLKDLFARLVVCIREQRQLHKSWERQIKEWHYP